MQKCAGIFLGALVLVSGCDTVPRSGTRRATQERPPDWGLPAETNAFPAPTPLDTAPFPPSPTNTPPTSAPVTNAPPTNPPSRIVKSPEATWLSLDRWAREHGREGLRRTALAPVPGFALPTQHGLLTLRPGSLSASCDGLEFRLGFAPRLIDGQLFVHALDLVKQIEPLFQVDAPLDPVGKVIVLDPGHGGSDPGARSSADGRSEKSFTLDWALRTARLLEEKGWRVLLTRTNDTDVALAARVAFAEAQRADLFLSFHFNSAGENGREQSGLETYCLTPVGMPSSLTRGYEDNPAQSYPNNTFDQQNFQLALQLHRALLKVNGAADRGVRRARFLTVLCGQNRPAVLLEGGYLSNPREARQIGETAYRQKLAEAVAEGLE